MQWRKTWGEAHQGFHCQQRLKDYWLKKNNATFFCPALFVCFLRLFEPYTVSFGPRGIRHTSRTRDDFIFFWICHFLIHYGNSVLHEILQASWHNNSALRKISTSSWMERCIIGFSYCTFWYLWCNIQLQRMLVSLTWLLYMGSHFQGCNFFHISCLHYSSETHSHQVSLTFSRYLFAVWPSFQLKCPRNSAEVAPWSAAWVVQLLWNVCPVWSSEHWISLFEGLRYLLFNHCQVSLSQRMLALPCLQAGKEEWTPEMLLPNDSLAFLK